MKKRTIWKNIILIISVWVIVIVATLAWFYSGTTAEINDLSVRIGEATYVQVSGDGGNNWSEDLEIEIGVNKRLKEMSGDGSKLFTPVYEVLRKPNGSLISEITTFEEVKDNALYYEHIFDFRSDADYDLYLDPQSFVSPVSDTEEAYIVGAVRVGFYELDENGNETLKCIWAPNSKVQYSPQDGSFTMDGTPETYYYYQKTERPIDIHSIPDGAVNPNVAKISTQGNTAECGCGYNADHKFMWSCGRDLPDNAPALLSIRLDGDVVAEKRLKVKVWLEGYDRECVSQISGQRFTMHFQFDAEKENNDE